MAATVDAMRMVVTVAGERFEVAPRPVDYVMAERKFNSLAEAPQVSLALFLAWSVLHRTSKATDSFDAWLEKVDDIEVDEDAPLEPSSES